MVTIKDIANRLGIAPSTVSRALNNHPKIKKSTKEKVLQVAKELHYEPNKIALSLKNNRTKTIGVIIPEIVHYFFSNVIAGIEEIAYANDYTVMFCQSNELFEKEVKDIYALLSHRVDGLLVSHSKETKTYNHFEEVQRRKVPIVFFDRSPDSFPASKVLIDDYHAAKEAVTHLIQKGCKNIIHLASNLHLEISKNRMKGYMDALIENNIPYSSSNVIDTKKGNEAAGYEILKRILEQENTVDGVFTSNDLLALGAYQAILDKGKHIPNDIKIVGFGDWNFCPMLKPSLTSIHQPGFEMGKLSMQTLLQEIKSKNVVPLPNSQFLKTTLIQRDSSS